MELADLKVSPQRAALVVIDVQERLAAAMPEAVRERLEQNVTILLEAARRFALPVVVSEQYPKGLGPTTARVAAALDAVAPQRIEKLDFVCDARVPGRDQWIVTGMECHVCVWQTVRALRERGDAVHVVGDAVASRAKASWRTGLALAERAGAVITTTEVVVFDLLGKAGTDDFKALSKLIK